MALVSTNNATEKRNAWTRGLSLEGSRGWIDIGWIELRKVRSELAGVTVKDVFIQINFPVLVLVDIFELGPAGRFEFVRG